LPDKNALPQHRFEQKEFGLGRSVAGDFASWLLAAVLFLCLKLSQQLPLGEEGLQSAEVVHSHRMAHLVLYKSRLIRAKLSCALTSYNHLRQS